MGVYLNPGNDMFQTAINSEIYVDKTELISITNKVLGTMQKFQKKNIHQWDILMPPMNLWKFVKN